MHLDRDFVGQLTPLQCRNGPIKSQQCTDFHCCVIYLVLIGIAFFFSLLSMGGIKMTPQQIQLKVSQTKFGAPLYSIMQAWVPIIVSLSFIAAICIIFVLTSFIIPAIITFIYIPLLQIILLGGGTIFLLRYLGIKLPFIQEDIQARFAHQSSTYTLIVSIAFYVGFLAAFFTLCLKRSKIRYIYPVLRIAKIAFWPNFYIFCFPFIFSILSIATIIGNVALLSISLTRKTQIIHKNTAAILILIQAFMTHGLIISLSDFFTQSIAIHWYYKKRRDFTKEGRCCDTLFLTLQMMVRHIGTIVHGFIIAYIPETLNTFISRFEGKSALCYHVLCLWHKFTIRDLSKYCYFQTIMQSFQFGIANRQMYGLRQRAKKVVPQIYMMGSFYATLTKICSGVMGLILCYFLMGNSPELADQFSQPSKLIGPLIIVFFGGQEISNHFMNVTGILGDTIVFAYFADIQIEKKDFGDAQPYSCPNEIRDIIYQVKAGQQYISD